MAKNRHHDGPGPSQRQLRVGATRVDRSLMHGTIELDHEIECLLRGGDGAPEALEALRRNRHELRRAGSKAVKLKFSPELRFVLDDTFDRMDETRRLFAQDSVRRDLED